HCRDDEEDGGEPEEPHHGPTALDRLLGEANPQRHETAEAHRAQGHYEEQHQTDALQAAVGSRWRRFGTWGRTGDGVRFAGRLADLAIDRDGGVDLGHHGRRDVVHRWFDPTDDRVFANEHPATVG